MSHLNIRWKLTLWYGGVLTVVLAFFSGSVYFVLRHELLQRIDQGLHEEHADVLSEVRRHRDEKTLLEWLNRRFAHHEGFDFQITRPDGSTFFINDRLAERSILLPLESTSPSTARYESVGIKSLGRWRVLTTKSNSAVGPLTIKVGRSLAAFEHESQELLFTFWLTGPLTLIIALGGGYFLARRALEPVQFMTQTAKQITADRLNQRIKIGNPHDELGELALTLNDMIERLERSFNEMQRFTADAAHELRTPLAVLRNEAEVALRTPRSTVEYCRVLANLLEETNHMSHLADQLLFLSRQDAGLQPKGQDVVRIDLLLQEVVGNMELLANEKEVILRLERNDRGEVAGDAGQLRRVFYNLLDNAIKYTFHPGKVTVATQAHDGTLTVTVTDTGIGIPAEHLPHIFDRFYRVDPARSDETTGAGLGLAICLAIVRQIGGSITIDSLPGSGTRASVRLPLVS